MNRTVLRTKTYVNADPEETIGATGFAAQTMSLHDVIAFRVRKNPKHHLPRDEDIVFIDIALKTPEGEKQRGFSITLYANEEAQL
jgi:hypothetical protein